MQTLGVRLRLERERQQLALPRIAEETCISQRYLEAIEADDLAALPGDFFYRSFVRQYSKYLGWNPDEVEQQINEVSAVPSAELAIAPSQPESLHLSSGRSSAMRESLREMPMRSESEPGMSKAWLGFALLVIVACGTYFAWRNFGVFADQKPQDVQTAKTDAPPVPAVTTPPPQVTVESGVPDTSPKPEPPVATPVPAPVAPSAEAVKSPASGQISLVVRARAVTWIRITADGTKIYGGTIEAGQERVVNAKDVELIVGNAGTIDVIYNGKPLAYGSKGEVKTLLLNSNGWKYKTKAQSDSPQPNPAASSTGNNTASAAAPGSFQQQ